MIYRLAKAKSNECKDTRVSFYRRKITVCVTKKRGNKSRSASVFTSVVAKQKINLSWPYCGHKTFNFGYIC